MNMNESDIIGELKALRVEAAKQTEELQAIRQQLADQKVKYDASVTLHQKAMRDQIEAWEQYRKALPIQRVITVVMLGLVVLAIIAHAFLK
jgi:vacuolar-type H+-ATPase subunit I/STV1